MGATLITSGSSSPLDSALQTQIKPDGRAIRITVGADAYRLAQSSNDRTPILAAGLTRAEFESIKISAPASAVFIDPDPRYQLRLIDAVFGSSTGKPVTAFIGPSAQRYSPELLVAAKPLGIPIQTLDADDEPSIGRALQKIDRSLVVLAVPDNLLWSRDTRKLIIAGTYRHDVPLVGYSEGIIKAGAMMGVIVDIDRYAAAVAQLVSDFDKTGNLPVPAPPGLSLLSIRVNIPVAKSFGITVDPARIEKAVLAP